MSTLTLIPDGAAVLGGYLDTHPAIVALQARVGSKTPKSMTRPWIRVRRLDAPKSRGSTPEHLIGFLFQIDCFASTPAMDEDRGHAEAVLLGRTVRAVIADAPGQAFEDVVVTDAQIVGDADIPDTESEPARERIALTATIKMHAKPGA